MWTVGGIWKNFPPKLLQLLKSGSCTVGYGIITAVAVLPLGNQSISRGPRQSKNDVSMTLPALGTTRLFFSRGNYGCFHCWLVCLVSRSYYKHQDSSPPTIRAKNSSPLSYRSNVPDTHASCRLFLVLILRHSSRRILPTPQNLRHGVTHTFHTDAKAVTDYVSNDDHTVPFYPLGTCVWVRNFWWTTVACQVLSAARTLFEPRTSNTAVRCRHSS